MLPNSSRNEMVLFLRPQPVMEIPIHVSNDPGGGDDDASTVADYEICPRKKYKRLTGISL